METDGPQGAPPTVADSPVTDAAMTSAASGDGSARVRVSAGPTVATRDAALGFGANTVLTGVTVSFRPLAINALIGPTGCGKSTLLRSINRMNDKVRG
jgi:phosphate transport system ATP-binding protein